MKLVNERESLNKWGEGLTRKVFQLLIFLITGSNPVERLSR
jgi:hypothetical protein